MLKKINNFLDVNGIIVLNKQTGMNSLTSVKKVQSFFNAKKAGHLGTLDPLASGVLVVALGNATKLFEKHLNEKKLYRAVFKFGVETTTLDSEGEILKEENVDINSKDVKNACKELIGTYEQMPPKFSSKKIGGKNAYELARKGKDFKLSPKKITIFDFHLIKKLEKNTFLFELETSSGTYIRSCCDDLSKKLGTCATMVALIRLKAGEWDVSSSVILQQLTTKDLLQNEVVNE